MERVYRSEERRRRGETGRGVKRRGRVELGARERRRLIQLVLCAVLFAGVFAGRGLFPGRLLAAREDVLRLLRTDVDFTAAFARLGRSVSDGASVTGTLGELWVDVFGAGTVTAAPGRRDSALRRADEAFLAGRSGTEQTAAAYLLGVEVKPEETPEPAPTPAEETPPAEEQDAEPAVVHADYTGPALPENTSMDRYALGLGETAAPVGGWLSSAFGWREHPVDGAERFHNGVDLAVNNGTSVKAFAAGTVDYIGDSPIYGKYLQLRHAGGVTSFYAHCSKLCVQQGQEVAAGQEVALSGDTGNATGPHLHFEIKKDGVRLNPMYYIDLSEG